jgi:predicted transcriptional regulator
VTIQTATVQSFVSPMAQTRMAANDIAAKLAAAEAAIDAAIAAVAALTASIPAGAAQANVGMHVGHEALMHASESCSQLVKSRTNMIRTHKALRTAQDDVGLGEVAFMGNCPPDMAEAGESTRHLSVAA